MPASGRLSTATRARERSGVSGCSDGCAGGQSWVRSSGASAGEDGTWGTDTMTFQDDELSYALGKQGGTRPLMPDCKSCPPCFVVLWNAILQEKARKGVWCSGAVCWSGWRGSGPCCSTSPLHLSPHYKTSCCSALRPACCCQVALFSGEKHLRRKAKDGVAFP